MKNKVVIGIDQSYTRTGITVLKNKNILRMTSVEFEDCETNTEKRTYIWCVLERYFKSLVKPQENEVIVITERIRLRSQGFLSESYIKATGALVATIIDVCKGYNVPVYSVDTRAWKSAIIGSSKPLNNPYGINPEKYRTILYMRDRGLLHWIAEEYKGRGEKGVIWANKRSVDGKKEKVRIKINDDLADSYCIAMYGFLPEGKRKLKEEKF